MSVQIKLGSQSFWRLILCHTTCMEPCSAFQPPSASVVWINAATPFRREAPEMFCGLKKLHPAFLWRLVEGIMNSFTSKAGQLSLS